MRETLSIPQWCDCCVAIIERVRDGIVTFQSHNGAIAAKPNTTPNHDFQDFQSHNGAIAANPLSLWERPNLLPFNPTMVRLLRSRPGHHLASGLCFQSHNGAIAACLFANGLTTFADLSIPQWCDCCPSPSGRVLVEVRFQSHNGAIAACKFSDLFSEQGSFQSHNGAIAASSMCWRPNKDEHFQSHNGAIAA